MYIYQFANNCFNAPMMTINEIRKINYELLRKESGLDKGKFAEKMGTDPSYMSQIFSEKSKRNIGRELARKIEYSAGKSVGWMDVMHEELYGYIDSTATRIEPSSQQHIEPNASWLGIFEEWDSATPLNDDEVALPFFREVEMAAGNGRHQVQENHGCKLRFSKSTLKRHGVSVDSAYCVTVSGDSMSPMMPDGCVIGVDTSITAIKDRDIYAIDHNGFLRVKQLFCMPDGRVRLHSLNEDWIDDFIGGDDLSTFKVLGRVFWGSWLR